MRDPKALEVQYQDDRYLRMRIETHQRYTVGPGLEDAVDQALALSGLESLLDMGTGPGDFPGRLKAGGHSGRLVGVDFSSGMVEQARGKHSGVEFVQADAQNLPFDDGTFDRVTARHMLYHIPDPDKAIREARRVLKAGGRFLALTNANGSMAEFWAAVEEAVSGDPDFEPLMRDRRAPPFDHNHLLESVRAVFGNASLEAVDSALLFPDAAPVLTYFDSIRTMRSIPEAAWDRGRERMEKVLETRSWPWRVSKAVVLVVAQKMSSV